MGGRMLINEIFSSIDGEGIRTGNLVTFIRSYGCSLLCKYCDTLYAVKPETEEDKKNAFTEMSVETIVEKCKELGNKRITFTGGEPLIQKDAKELLSKLTIEGFEVNVETNGKESITPFVTFDGSCPIAMNKLIITMDWKSPYSGMRDQMLESNLLALRYNDVLKFVVANKEDLDDMKDILSKFNVRCHVFVSPVFNEIDPVEIIEYLKENNLQDVRVQLQLHKIIWKPEERGV